MVSRLRGSLFQLPVLILLLATAALLLQVYSFCSLSSYRFFDVRSWSHTSWRAAEWRRDNCANCDSVSSPDWTILWLCKLTWQ